MANAPLDRSAALLSKLSAVRLLAMDVDGVLTCGEIEVNSDGFETKRFHVADGLGIQLCLLAGLQVAWISGRSSEAVSRRAAELNIPHLTMGCANKAKAVAELIGRFTLQPENVAYIGDDLNDLPALSLAGVRFAPSNAISEVKALADMVTERSGGCGAVREVCDVILKAQEKWNGAVEIYLAGLLRP